MNALSALATNVDPTQGVTATSTAELAKRGQIDKTAQGFESSFLTTMFETMFSSVPTDSAFGGGPGEDMWKSFLAEAVAKQSAKHGGIGISKAVAREMLKLQGLSETPQSAKASKATGVTAKAPLAMPSLAGLVA
jgi:peptidoglycan hydrolase FlgJ